MNRRLLIFLAKLAVTGGLLFWLLRTLDIDALWRQAQLLDAASLVPAALLILATSALHAWRWLFVFPALDERISFRLSVKTVLIGSFFNQTLPSAIGGDAVRVWQLHRHGLRFVRAVHAVLLDRGAALVALLIVMACMLPALHATVPDDRAKWSLTTLTIVGVFGFFVFLVLDKIVVRARRWRVVAFFADLAAAARRLFTAARQAVPLLAVSIAIHICTIAAVFLLFRAQHATPTLWQCGALVPPIVLASMAPISIAGWGVREGAMVLAFGWVGMPAEAALLTSVLLGATGLLIGIPGGLLFLGAQRRRGATSQNAPPENPLVR